MSDAELDALDAIAAEFDPHSAHFTGEQATGFFVGKLRDAITQLRTALADSQREHQFTADMANSLAEELEAAQRLDFAEWLSRNKEE